MFYLLIFQTCRMCPKVHSSTSERLLKSNHKKQIFLSTFIYISSPSLSISGNRKVIDYIYTLGLVSGFKITDHRVSTLIV